MGMIGRRLNISHWLLCIHHELRLVGTAWYGGIYTPRTIRTSTEWCGRTSTVSIPYQANIDISLKTHKTYFEEIFTAVIEGTLAECILVAATTARA